MKTFKQLMEEIQNALFTIEDFEEGSRTLRPLYDLARSPRSKVQYVSTTFDKARGKDKPILHVRVSLDKEENWRRRHFKNSRYIIFQITWDGMMNESDRLLRRSAAQPLEPFIKGTPHDPRGNVQIKNMDQAAHLIDEWASKNAKW